ncbi:pseudaminic acid cytidylyltransferase [Balneatrix alpica]|uniref:Pseudaminic acid cytidylyltransferase n=1 Tax=Balneatrix alpica TaxID=75684 RepID=A0ABV5ZEC6_9GAMM|nr:pseudaminic acid cytidylyltransferase [Balneatrix alpica]
MAKVAIIPARGGSKRIPRKNIRDFAGQPLLAYSIQAAIQADVFERIIVSTDDAEIAAVAQAYGAEVPFIRPANLADDHTGTGAVVFHALDWLAEHDRLQPEYVCCIYATAPLLQAEDLKAAITELEQRPEMQHAFSVTRFAYPVQRGLVRAGEGVSMLFPEYEATRSQDLPEVYHDAGMFYWSRTAAFASNAAMFAPHSIPHVLPSWRVQDIDTEEDWQRAELLYQVLQRQAQMS